MRSRAISVMVAAVATAAALAQPARAAPLIDGVYRFAALKDGQCLVWPKLNGSTGMVSLGACTDNSATSANWRVRQRPNGTMEVSTPGSNPSTCLMVTTGHRVMISDNCADKYAEWTVSYGSAGPGSVVWADIEHTPGDHSGSWGKLLDTPDVIEQARRKTNSRRAALLGICSRSAGSLDSAASQPPAPSRTQMRARPFRLDLWFTPVSTPSARTVSARRYGALMTDTTFWACPPDREVRGYGDDYTLTLLLPPSPQAR